MAFRRKKILLGEFHHGLMDTEPMGEAAHKVRPEIASSVQVDLPHETSTALRAIGLRCGVTQSELVERIVRSADRNQWVPTAPQLAWTFGTRRRTSIAMVPRSLGALHRICARTDLTQWRVIAILARYLGDGFDPPPDADENECLARVLRRIIDSSVTPPTTDAPPTENA